MKKASLLFVLLFTMFVFAQTFEEKNTSATTDNSPKSAVLWDNTNIAATTSGLVSTYYGGRAVGQRLVNSADDITVPAGQVWRLDSVYSQGFKSSTATFLPNSYGFAIYQNTNNAPGTLIYSNNYQSTWGAAGTNIGQNISAANISLNPGKYWVSVYGVYDTSSTTTTGRWNWTYGPTGIDSTAQLEDETTLFGGFAWTPLWSLGLANKSMYFKIYGTALVPVELTSFTANVSGANVQLNWVTATELNNKGFEIQKKSTNGQFITLAFVNGMGTSTETHNYSFTDKCEPGNFSYRLKKVDFNGAADISKSVEIVVNPNRFELGNNYPNPFNPSTKISFSLSVDSKVNLNIFNILGQKVASLINGNVPAGTHEVKFNASNLNSGVYIYKIEATGIDGQNFTSVKKMILNK